MKRIFLSSKIYFVFLVTLSACGIFNNKDGQNVGNLQVEKNIFVNGRKSLFATGQKVWDSEADYLSQQVFSAEYSTILDNDTGRLTFLPRNEAWDMWDVQRENSLPIVVSNSPKNKLEYYNKGFPVLTDVQMDQLKKTGSFDFIDPESADTQEMRLVVEQPKSTLSVHSNGVVKQWPVLNFKGDSDDKVRLCLLSSFENPLVLKFEGVGDFRIASVVTDVPKAPAKLSISQNMVFNYSATSPEGTMNIRMRISKVDGDTVSCTMEGSVDDSYEYKFNNVVLYGGQALTNPRFVPFLPSLILDSLFYDNEGMCFLSDKTLSSWYGKNGDVIGVEHFVFDKSADDEVKAESYGLMQAFKEGKQKFSSITLGTSRAGVIKNKEYAVCKFANYTTKCFLEVMPTDGLGIVYRVASSDMLWDIQLDSIQYD